MSFPGFGSSMSRKAYKSCIWVHLLFQANRSSQEPCFCMFPLKRSNYAMNLQIWVLTLQFDLCHQTSIQCYHQFFQLGQYKARWARNCKFRKGAWLLSVKSSGPLGFERAKRIRAIWRWWDTWVEEDSSFWESREKTGYTVMKNEWQRKEEEAWKNKREVLRCTPGPGFKGTVRFWIGLQLSDADFQLNFKSWKESEESHSKKEREKSVTLVMVQ